MPPLPVQRLYAGVEVYSTATVYTRAMFFTMLCSYQRAGSMAGRDNGKTWDKLGHSVQSVPTVLHVRAGGRHHGNRMEKPSCVKW